MRHSGRRVLVDECVPHQLLRVLAQHVPRTIQAMGWHGIKNGRLLKLAAQEFDVVFTVDRHFAGVTNTVSAHIGIVILQGRSTDFDVLAPLMPAVNEAIWSIQPGQVLRISE